MKTLHRSLAVLLAASMPLSACGRFSQQQPRSHDPRAVPTSSVPTSSVPTSSAPKKEAPTQPPPKRYGWGLPVGDVSPNQDELNVYLLLHKGECAEAKSYLEETKVWQHFASPRDVLLTWAAVAFCSGDTTTATKLYRQAESLGWRGLLPQDGKAHAACEYYKSASSVIKLRPRPEFSCPGGEPPQWAEPDTEKRQDPR